MVQGAALVIYASKHTYHKYCLGHLSWGDCQMLWQELKVWHAAFEPCVVQEVRYPVCQPLLSLREQDLGDLVQLSLMLQRCSTAWLAAWGAA